MSERKVSKKKQSRSRRVNLAQLEAIINFLNSNSDLINEISYPVDPEDLDTKWSSLSTALNEIENGAQKEKEQWLKFFIDWRVKVRKKTRRHKKSLIKDGRGGFIMQDLTDVENRLMRLEEWIAITGYDEFSNETGMERMPSVPEETNNDIIADNSQIHNNNDNNQKGAYGNAIARNEESEDDDIPILVPLKPEEHNNTKENGRIIDKSNNFSLNKDTNLNPAKTGHTTGIADKTIHSTACVKTYTGTKRSLKKHASALTAKNATQASLENVLSVLMKSSREISKAVKEIANNVEVLAVALTRIANAVSEEQTLIEEATNTK